MTTRKDLEHEKQLKSLVIVALGSFLLFFYVFISGVGMFINPTTQKNSPSPDIYGSSTVDDGSNSEVLLLLNNAKVGFGSLELSLTNPAKIAGAEFNFRIDGDLELLDVYCVGSEFVCSLESNEGAYTLNVLRMPTYANNPLSGVVTIATVSYNPETAGELQLNTDDVTSSSVVTVGTAQNILTGEPLYLAIGQSQY